MSVSTHNDAYNLFLCAVREAESASLNRKKNSYSVSLKLYKKSASYFTRALFSANGKAQDESFLSESEMIAQLSKLSEESEQVLKPIIAVMMFNASDALDENPENFKDISCRYQEALVAGRRILIDDLKYHQKYLNWLSRLSSPKGNKKLYFTSIIILLLFLSTYVAYIKAEPVYNANLVSQLFWRTDAITPFNVDHSNSYPVREGKVFREYTITLPESTNLNSLRLDPMHINRRILAEIGIEWIRLLSEQGILLKEFTAKDLQKWTCTNCVGVDDAENKIFIMRVNNQRPHIVSGLIDQDNVKMITIKSRIISKKTFGEWFFNLEK